MSYSVGLCGLVIQLQIIPPVTYIIDQHLAYLVASVHGEMTVLKVIIKKRFASNIFWQADPLVFISLDSMKSPLPPRGPHRLSSKYNILSTSLRVLEVVARDRFTVLNMVMNWKKNTKLMKIELKHCFA